jgi:predicted nucleic acid-binding protein
MDVAGKAIQFALEWVELTRVLTDIRRFADVHDLTVDTHDRGLALAQRYQLNIYDAMIAAAALDAGCTTLMSEDFQGGQIFDRRLRVRDPFR